MESTESNKQCEHRGRLIPRLDIMNVLGRGEVGVQTSLLTYLENPGSHPFLLGLLPSAKYQASLCNSNPHSLFLSLLARLPYPSDPLLSVVPVPCLLPSPPLPHPPPKATLLCLPIFVSRNDLLHWLKFSKTTGICSR